MEHQPSPPFIIVVAEGRFPLGQLVITPGALGRLAEREIEQAVNRHASGDWGELPEEDVGENRRALEHGYRLFSAYRSDDRKTRFYVITEADRSVTTVLLPEEY